MMHAGIYFFAVVLVPQYLGYKARAAGWNHVCIVNGVWQKMPPPK